MYLHFQLVSCVVEDRVDLFSENDTFCEVRFQGVTKRTIIMEDDSSPFWGEKGEFVFRYNEDLDDTIFVDIYDSDGWRNELIKTVSFTIRLTELESFNSMDDTKDSVQCRYALVQLLDQTSIECIKRRAIDDLKMSIDKLFKEKATGTAS